MPVLISGIPDHKKQGFGFSFFKIPETVQKRFFWSSRPEFSDCDTESTLPCLINKKV